MPNYKERSQQIKALSEKQYLDARLKKDESESVRIGDRDGTTGRYEILHQDGGVTRNGIKTFNQAAPRDGFVRVTGSGSGGIALDHLNKKQRITRRITEEISNPFIKYVIAKVVLSDIYVNGLITELFIGGDRVTPISIFTTDVDEDEYIYGAGPLTVDIGSQITLTSTGLGSDDWIVQVVGVKKTVIDQLYANPFAAIDYTKCQKLTTIRPSGVAIAYSDGVRFGDGSTITNVTDSAGIRFGNSGGEALLTVTDTYTATFNSDDIFTYVLVSRFITQQYNPTSAASFLGATSNSLKVMLEAPSSPFVVYWTDLASTGLPSTLDGFTIFGGKGSDITISQCRIGKVNNFIGKNGWWFANPSVAFRSNNTVAANGKVITAYASFRCEDIAEGDVVPFTKRTFNTSDQVNTILLADIINLEVTGASSLSQKPISLINQNITGFNFKSFQFIQGLNLDTQLIKIGDEYRLYTGEDYVVVTFPSIVNGETLTNDQIESTFVSGTELLGDTLFRTAQLERDQVDLKATIFGYQLTEDPPTGIGSIPAKTANCNDFPFFSEDLSEFFGAIAFSITLTIGEYDVLEDADA